MRKKLKKGVGILLTLIMIMMIIPISTINVNAASNPFSKYLSTGKVNCTWYAWQAAYDRSGVALPMLGNGGQWIDTIKKYGYNYSYGTIAQANSIAVWTNSGAGHVGYVTSVSGDIMYIDEGGNNSTSTGIATNQKRSSVVGSVTNGLKLVGFIYLQDTTAPSITNVSYTEQSSSYLKVRYTVKDNIGSVRDEIYVYTPSGTKLAKDSTEDGTYTFSFKWENSPDGYYYFVINEYDAAGNKASVTTPKVLKDTTGPTGSNIQVTDVTSQGYRVTLNVSDNFSGVTIVQMPTWTTHNGQDDLPADWPQATLNGNTATFYVKTSDHNNEHGEYITNIYAFDGKGNHSYIGGVSVVPQDPGSPMTSGYAQVIPDGDYIIANVGTTDKTSYYYLDIPGVDHPAPNESNVVICGPFLNLTDVDIWTIKYENGFYKITQKGTNQALDAYKAGLTEGTNVQVWGDGGADNQRWAISHNGTSGYTIQAKHSGFALDVATTNQNMSNVTTKSLNNTLNQAWMFIPYKPEQTISNGDYVIASAKDDNYIMTVDGGSSNIQLGLASNSNIKNNTFSLTKLDNGYYKILDPSGKSMDLFNGGSNLFDNVIAYTDNGSIAQQWAIEKSGLGGYTIKPSCSGLPIGIDGDLVASGTNINQYIFTGNTSQTWKFVPAEYSVSYDLKGGSGNIPTQTKYYKNDLTLTSIIPTRSGFEFKGWSTSETATEVKYKSGELYKIDANVTLYAVWTNTNNGGNNLPNNPSGVDDFVTRCYKVALQRDPDQGGFDHWKSKITNGELVGSTVVYSFIFSEEYLSQNKTDKEYVKDLYTMFLGREPDQGGYDHWCAVLASGKTRKDVFAGFANSQEFYELCASYGITSGFYTNDYDLGRVNAVNLFVERLYKTCLGRLGDKGGQQNWVEGLLNGRLTGISCAANFIKSPEYESKGLSDEQYVENLYIGFMGRTYDEGGKANWLGHLTNKTKTRDQVFEGFANSPEFQGICASYGIDCGSYTAIDIANSKQ